MFAVSKPAGNDATEVVMGSWLFPGLGVFFLVLGALDVVAGLATGKIGNVIGPGVFCALAGIIYGFYPIRVVVKADRAADELSRRARSLFRSSDQTEKLSDFASVSIRAGTYYWFFEATRKDGMPLRLFSQMKTGFTWTKVPPADVAARAAQIAEALSLPVGPPRLDPANANAVRISRNGCSCWASARADFSGLPVPRSPHAHARPGRAPKAEIP
jgi:hypothetical protein